MKLSFTPRRATSGSSGAAIAADMEPVPQKWQEPPIIHTTIAHCDFFLMQPTN